LARLRRNYQIAQTDLLPTTKTPRDPNLTNRASRWQQSP